MRNIVTRVSALLLMALLIILTACTVFAPSYSSSGLTTQTTQTQQDGYVITKTAYLSSSGKIVAAGDKGYAVVIKTALDGKTVLEEYQDENGNPAVLSAGYSSVRREYTDGLNTAIIYLDDQKQPVVISSGYDTIRRTYNGAGLSDTDTYWAGEEQVSRKQGYWSLKRIYGTGDHRRRVVRQEYRDRNDRLTENSSGYAYWEREYNGQGKVAVQKFYDPEGRPASVGIGYCGYLRAYDDEGRVIQTTYLGADGEAADTSRGYAIVKTVYDGSGKKTFYYDRNGHPVTAGKSQFGVLKTDEGSTYLNEDGEVFVRLDNILQTNSGLVLFFGVFAVVTALLAGGRLRVAFAVIYVCFILYMTMAWRETWASRSRFDLFWSYSRFLTNRKQRLHILENIWLFVPFGTAAGGIIRDRLRRGTKAVGWTILISILLSAAIETVQLIAGIGLCEIDDVVSNSLGGLIGALIQAADFRKHSAVSSAAGSTSGLREPFFRRMKPSRTPGEDRQKR